VDRFRASTRRWPRSLAEKVGPGTPIEPRIERERGVPDLRLRAQLGRDLVRALTAAGRAADAQRLTAAAPLASENAGAPGRAPVPRGRVPCPLPLRSKLGAEIAAADAPLKALLTAWRDRFARSCPLARRSRGGPDARARVQHAGGGRARRLGLPTANGEPLDWRALPRWRAGQSLCRAT
jgi:hypothetical protein